MDTVLASPPVARAASPFDLDDAASYQRWRAWKLAQRPAGVAALTVDVADPRALSAAERAALLDRIQRANMALYRSPVIAEDKDLPRALGAQLGLHRLDANWLADEDGISSIAVSERTDGRGGFIPYTDRPIRWHTDGYYHPAGRRIRGMILHCVRPAMSGGISGLLDHELAYMALRDASPSHVRALMQPDAMTIPARADDDGEARPAQSGPVFAVDDDGSLHMRYTARTRSIEWKADAATRGAVAALEALLAGDTPWILRTRLDAGMGLVGHNVLHERSGFSDDPGQPRLLYRARFLDRVALPMDCTWR
ncbi:MAG: TauD/TfdA family dioxygenase [Rubrivivax sp.]|nr:TauD/TfdA family dioxygenase [Rubrivivax sp.]